MYATGTRTPEVPADVKGAKRRRLERTDRNLQRIFDAWTNSSKESDAYVGLALQYQSLRPWEATALAHIRQNDAGQIAAVNILTGARNARAARWAVIVAALSVPLNVALTLALQDDPLSPTVVVQAPP